MEGGTLTATSEVLGLDLRLTPGVPVRESLRFYDPVRGEYLRSLREAEARLQEERATRQALEAELRELRQRGH